MKPHGLARLLRGFGIKSKLIKLHAVPKRGYEKEAFTDAFERYLGLPEQDDDDAAKRVLPTSTKTAFKTLLRYLTHPPDTKTQIRMRPQVTK